MLARNEPATPSARQVTSRYRCSLALPQQFTLCRCCVFALVRPPRHAHAGTAAPGDGRAGAVYDRIQRRDGPPRLAARRHVIVGTGRSACRGDACSARRRFAPRAALPSVAVEGRGVGRWCGAGRHGRPRWLGDLRMREYSVLSSSRSIRRPLPWASTRSRRCRNRRARDAQTLARRAAGPRADVVLHRSVADRSVADGYVVGGDAGGERVAGFEPSNTRQPAVSVV